MWEKLAEVEKRFLEIEQQLASSEVHSNRELLLKYTRAKKELREIVATLRAYRKAKEELAGSNEIMNNASESEIIQLAREEANMLQAEMEGLEQRLRFLLLPKDPNDDKNVILEIRAGTGGDEAALFAGDLFRMYLRYAEGRRWRIEMLSMSDGSTGGYKEVIAMVTGEGAFSRLKFERGVHRVQRVPKTEAQGRIHTSTVTVAVLPEAEEVEVQINDSWSRHKIIKK